MRTVPRNWPDKPWLISPPYREAPTAESHPSVRQAKSPLPITREQAELIRSVFDRFRA
jgi:hypothetical protein